MIEIPKAEFVVQIIVSERVPGGRGEHRFVRSEVLRQASFKIEEYENDNGNTMSWLVGGRPEVRLYVDPRKRPQ